MTPEEFKEMRQILWQFVPIENYGEALAELEKIARRTVSGQEPIYQARSITQQKDYWGDCSKDAHDHMAKYPLVFETRVLYAAPIPATEQKDAEQ